MTDRVVCTIENGHREVRGVEHVLKVHSPTGFDWGSGGSGAADLALNILYKVTGDEQLARDYYQEFKWQFISPMPFEGGEILFEDVKKWLDDIRLYRKARSKLHKIQGKLFTAEIQIQNALRDIADLELELLSEEERKQKEDELHQRALSKYFQIESLIGEDLKRVDKMIDKIRDRLPDF